MADLPVGTLTFLYTDIEGSTVRWERNPGAMKAAVERHDALVRDAIVANDGVVFRRMGDAFCASFRLASNAVDAALAAQHVLDREQWNPEVAPIRVRMALHTGPGEVREGDYVGPHLNRIARLMAVAHGGQTILTQATYELICESLPAGAGLRDLGDHRLKDLQRPEHIYQLFSTDLPSDFPALKTLNARPNNLPVQPTGFIGRAREVEQAQELLMRPNVRLLTFTGPGGTGKSRLSLQVAAAVVERFPDGDYFVPLTSVSDASLVPSAIAEVLDVTEGGGRSVLDNLKSYLRQKEMLLVLDNFEQVVPAARAVSEMLSVAPQLKVLVTSREVLHVYGEKEFPVPPLQLPDPKRLPDLETLARFESVSLFVERATNVKPDFELTEENAPAIAEICNRLDGLPLALELAAARIKILTPQAMLSRLENRLKMLTSGARDLPARQQTLRGAIDWSYDLLSPDERTLFCRIAIFVGGCTFEAAEAVCAGGDDAPSTLPPLDIDVLDGLASLVDKSLLRQTEPAEGDARFMMLETIREYALEKLVECGELDATRQAHARYYLLVAEEASPLIQTKAQRATVQKLEAEHDNIRAALDWSLTEDGNRALGLRIATALHRFWHLRGHLGEGRRWMEALLPGNPEHTQLRISALYAAGYMTFLHGDGEKALSLLRESADLARELKDSLGLAFASYLLGAAMVFGGDDKGLPINEEGVSLFRQEGLSGRPGLVLALLTRGLLAFIHGDYQASRAAFEENQVLAKQLGDYYALAQTSNYLGDIARIECDYPRAGALYGESLPIMQDQGGRSDIPAILHNVGYVALAEGDYARAEELFKESMALQQEMWNMQGISECLTGFAALATGKGDPQKAARLFGASEAIRTAAGVYMWPAERIEWERHTDSARSQLTPEKWEAAWQEGQAMTTEQAVEYVLRANVAVAQPQS